MKKFLGSTLTTTLIIGLSEVTCAESNPFSDVPTGHWAYQSVAKLANQGVIEGYSNGTYRGDRNIAYAKNTKADYENSSWQIQFDLGNYVSGCGLAKHLYRVRTSAPNSFPFPNYSR